MTEVTLATGKADELPASAADLVPALPDDAVASTLFWTLKMKVGGRQMDLRVASSDTISDLKEAIFSLSNVPPDRQKILGLVKGRLPADEELLDQIGLFDGKAFSVLGTPVGSELQRGGGPDVLDDLDGDVDMALLRNPALDDRNKRRIQEAAAKLSLNIMTAPRPGKRLLVLDLDYTLLDCSLFSDPTVHSLDMCRPHLDAFLTAAYKDYDLVIWSQTNWRWLESKLIEMNMVGHDHDRYHISFVLDRLPMFKVQSLRDGKPHSHEVKSLALIWAKFPELYSAKNTLHIDDLSRNFVLNPGNGVKCRAFTQARKNRDDKELLYLTRYLQQMASEPDLSKVDHSHWRKKPGVKDPPPS